MCAIKKKANSFLLEEYAIFMQCVLIVEREVTLIVIGFLETLALAGVFILIEINGIKCNRTSKWI
ncbi:hypothetical protein [Psychrobacillus sp. FJAT-51614]|uniref:hypothetical protein n=1 Tax=Psychrobacillus mangrovi TaxID=3117745 RepID=UPI003013D4BF